MSMLDQAPGSAAAGKGELVSNFGLSLRRRLNTIVNALRGRRLVTDMRSFDDAQLADIGLKRNDLDNALQLPLSADPSLYLVRARQNPLRGSKRF